MEAKFVEITFGTVLLAAYVAAPTALVAGWFKSAKLGWPQTVFGWMTLASLTLATASALLAIGSLLYGNSIGGWPYYDRRLMRIFACGALLSALALIVGLIGSCRRNALRWLAPVASLGMLIFWLGAAEGE
jgi:hypothetical protein